MPVGLEERRVKDFMTIAVKVKNFVRVTVQFGIYEIGSIKNAAISAGCKNSEMFNE